MTFATPNCPQCAKRLFLFSSTAIGKGKIQTECGHCGGNVTVSFGQASLDIPMAGHRAEAFWKDGPRLSQPNEETASCFVCFGTVTPGTGCRVTSGEILDVPLVVTFAAKERASLFQQTAPGGDIEKLLGRDAADKAEILGARVCLDELSEHEDALTWICKKCLSRVSPDEEIAVPRFLTFPCMHCCLTVRLTSDARDCSGHCPRCGQKVTAPPQEHSASQQTNKLDNCRNRAAEWWDQVAVSDPINCLVCKSVILPQTGFLLQTSDLLVSERLLNLAIALATERLVSASSGNVNTKLNRITTVGAARDRAERVFIGSLLSHSYDFSDGIAWICNECIQKWEHYGSSPVEGDERIGGFWLGDASKATVDSSLGGRDYLEKLQGEAWSFLKPSSKKSRPVTEEMARTAKQLGIPEQEASAMASKPINELGDQHLRALVQELKPFWPADRRHILEETPVGCLPIRAATAETLCSPRGDPIIVLDVGLMILVNGLNKLISRFAGPDAPDPEDSDEFRRAGATIGLLATGLTMGTGHAPRVELPSDPVKAGLASRLTFVQELFILAHEFAHIDRGHLRWNRALNRTVSLRNGTLNYRFFTPEHAEEIEADLLASEVVLQYCRRRNSPYDFAAVEVFLAAIDMLESVDPRVKEALTPHPPTKVRHAAIRQEFRSNLRVEGLAMLTGVLGLFHLWGGAVERFMALVEKESQLR